MTDEIYVKRVLRYEQIQDAGNWERIAEIPGGAFNPEMMNQENVIVWCIDTETVDRVCADQADFDTRYRLEEE
jgi:hypothetical protein